MKTITIKYLLLIITAVLVTSACTKVITLNLGNDTGRLVIEANLTNVKGPQYVKISKNVPFTNTNVYPTVSGATVSVSDQNGHTYNFSEGPAGTYMANNLAGTPGSIYTVNVLTGGTTYTATSQMPTPVILDSITSENNEFGAKNRKKITIHCQDPAGVANQYRFLMYVNGTQINRVFAFNDRFTDGRYINFDLREGDIDIFSGDKVVVEMQCIDNAVYTYWYTLSQQQSNGPGGGVIPTDPPTNFTPTCLGYFSAHTTQTLTLLVK